ncbi:MAG: kinase-like domain-containing protein [Linnemannia elongata]|nr:MAG: kinase-like domain-containing protein [Linnemannia elongata]
MSGQLPTSSSNNPTVFATATSSTPSPRPNLDLSSLPAYIDKDAGRGYLYLETLPVNKDAWLQEVQGYERLSKPGHPNLLKYHGGHYYCGQRCIALDPADTHGVVHRDIKLENILLTASQEALISDLRISDALEENGHATGDMGTYGFKAPGMKGKYTAKVDAFSFGAL